MLSGVSLLGVAADREKRQLGRQLRLVAAELNWGQINLYLMSIMSAVMYHHEGPWGLVVCLVLLALADQRMYSAKAKHMTSLPS